MKRKGIVFANVLNLIVSLGMVVVSFLFGYVMLALTLFTSEMSGSNFRVIALFVLSLICFLSSIALTILTILNFTFITAEKERFLKKRRLLITTLILDIISFVILVVIGVTNIGSSGNKLYAFASFVFALLEIFPIVNFSLHISRAKKTGNETESDIKSKE